MTILAPTDFSNQSRTALRTATRFAVRRETDLVVLHCLESAVEDTPWRHLLEVPDNMRAHFWRAARDRLEDFVDESLRTLELPEEIECRVDLEYAEEGIQRAIEELGCELVVLGATGKGRVAHFFLGSTTERIVRTSPAPVWVTSEDDDTSSIERILAPVDFTDCSRHSLRMAADLAREYGARLDIVHAYALPVADTSIFPSQMSAETLERLEAGEHDSLDSFLEVVDLEGIEYTEDLRVGVPHRIITEAAEEDEADLIVMGTHGRRGLERLFLGSTTTKVLRHLPCPVLTLRSFVT